MTDLLSWADKHARRTHMEAIRRELGRPEKLSQPERFFCPTCGDEISGEYELCRGCAHEQHEEKRWEFWRE